MKTIIIFGIKRSGNHFLISSILQNFSNYVHINDYNIQENMFEKYIEFKDIDITNNTCDSSRSYDPEWLGFKGAECVIISLENQKINFDILDKFNKVQDCHIILLLRSPYSHFTSIWKEYDKNLYYTKFMLSLWKTYARIFTNDNYLIKVLYDEFNSNNEYFINTLKNIGIPLNKINKINKEKKIRRKEYDKNLYYTKFMLSLWKTYARIFTNDNYLIKVLYDEFNSNNEYFINTLKNIGIPLNKINKINKEKKIRHQKSSWSDKDDKNKGRTIYSTLENCYFNNDKLFVELLDDKEICNLWSLINPNNFL